MSLKPIACAFALIALPACTQQPPVMTDAQIVGTWSCAPRTEDVDGISWTDRMTTEIRPDHSFTTVTEWEAGQTLIRSSEVGTWRRDGDFMHWTVTRDALLHHSDPRLTEALWAAGRRVPRNEASRLVAFDGIKRESVSDRWLAKWMETPSGCWKL